MLRENRQNLKAIGCRISLRVTSPHLRFDKEDLLALISYWSRVILKKLVSKNVHKEEDVRQELFHGGTVRFVDFLGDT